MIETVKGVVKGTARVIGVLSSIYLLGWFFNGYKGTKFDLPELRQFIIWVYGVAAAYHFTDSTFNSPKGEFPSKEGGNAK
jgi:hypothetical protein